MKSHVLIFYTITTILLVLVNLLQESFLLPYIEVFFVVFAFAESYYVLQNYDFDHGIPFIATFLKLSNTIMIIAAPLFTLIFHIVIHIYIYSHIRGLNSRNTRLKYEYTVNNVIPGPLLLKVFAAFLSPIFFIMISILADMRIRQKLKRVQRVDLFLAIIAADCAVLLVKLTDLGYAAFLIYMIFLIMFEFTPINIKIES